VRIGLDSRTGVDFRFECIEVGLHLGFEPVQQLHNLSTADRDPVQGEQVRLKLSNGQPHHCAQGSDQASQSHPDPSLAYHLLVEIHRGFGPFLTASAPAFVDPMVRHLDWGRRGHINDLAGAGHTHATQTQMTVRATDKPMLHHLGRCGAWPPPIMLGVTLFANLLLLCWRFFLVRFDEGWWGRFQLLQFLNACLGNSQLLSNFIELL
jgi:hypothetical protein